MPKYRVFISYTMRGNGVNIEFLRLLKQKFNSRNLIQTYIDILDNCGENHQAFVIEQLSKADVVLLIQSEGIESSAWVETELNIAKERDIPIIIFTLDQIKAVVDTMVGIESLEKDLIRAAQAGIAHG